MPRGKERSSRYHRQSQALTTQIIAFADQLLPEEYRDKMGEYRRIGGVHEIAEHLKTLLRTGTDFSFLDHLDNYRWADARQNSMVTKEIRLTPRQRELKIKTEYWFGYGKISLEYVKGESSKIEIQGNVYSTLFADEHLVSLQRTNYPDLPDGITCIKEMCYLFKFDTGQNNEDRTMFHYSQEGHTLEKLRLLVAQTIILWDLITWGTEPKARYTESDIQSVSD